MNNEIGCVLKFFHLRKHTVRWFESLIIPKNYRKKLTMILPKLIPKIEKERILSNPFHETNINLISKSRKHTTRTTTRKL